MTYAEIEFTRAPFEAEYIPKVERALLDQGEDLAALIEAEDFPVSAFMDREPLRKVLRDLWTDVIPAFAEMASKEIEKMTKRTDPEIVDRWLEIVQEFIGQESGALITAIESTTLAIVREIIDEGITQGWGVREMAEKLREQWPEISKYRAERITRTEVVRGSNHGSWKGAQETAKNAGLTLNKVWQATDDARTRDTHATASGQTVALDEPFIVGGYQAMYPGDASLPPEESVQCRCTQFYETVEPKSWRDIRDDLIRVNFSKLRPKLGSVQAIEEIAEMKDVMLSPSQVRRIVYKGTRA